MLNTGRIVRQTGRAGQEDAATDLPLPTGLDFAPNGHLVFEPPAFGPDRGEGLGVLAASDPAMTPVSYAAAAPTTANCSA